MVIMVFYGLKLGGASITYEDEGDQMALDPWVWDNLLREERRFVEPNGAMWEVIREWGEKVPLMILSAPP